MLQCSMRAVLLRASGGHQPRVLLASTVARGWQQGPGWALTLQRAWQKGQEEGPVQPEHQARAPSSLPSSLVMKLQGKSKEGMCVCPPCSDIVIRGKGCSFLLPEIDPHSWLGGGFRSLEVNAQIKLSHCCVSGAQASVPGHILLAY